jgi:hypothetical protein
MSFFNTLQKNIEDINNLQMTENGAIGFKSTGKKLLDMNFNVPKYRKSSAAEICSDFKEAYAENETLAILWVFFARDVRGGLGERRLFRILFNELCKENNEVAVKLLPLIAEYGRWDDLIIATENTPVWADALEIIKEQLHTDIKNHTAGNSVSLLAKWLPSERTSSQKSRNLARKIANGIDFPIKNYNRALVTLRQHIDVVERKMSAKQWENIDYSTVPSGANLLYKNAFLRNDEQRRRAYLDSLVKGETKINSSVLSPHDIVHKYMNGGWRNIASYDTALEEMWKALPDVEGLENTIVVADGSGSMTCRIDPNSSTTALEVANAMAIYCAEHCNGEFKDKYITFSNRPQFVDFTRVNATSLHDKLTYALKFNEVASTNIEGVFDIILDTAVKSKAKQDEIPNTILIISDMEFNSCATTNRNSGYYGGVSPDDALFVQIAKKYENEGYKLPRLVFWNVNSRTGTIPVKENELGVTLVSGYSTSIFKMIQNGELDPYKNLVKTITAERYQPIIKALESADE